MYRAMTDNWLFQYTDSDYNVILDCRAFLDIRSTGLVLAYLRDRETGTLLQQGSGFIETYPYRDRYGRMKEGYEVRLTDGATTLDKERKPRHAAYRLVNHLINAELEGKRK
jgi:hypothetical protein